MEKVCHRLHVFFANLEHSDILFCAVFLWNNGLVDIPTAVNIGGELADKKIENIEMSQTRMYVVSHIYVFCQPFPILTQSQLFHRFQQ